MKIIKRVAIFLCVVAFLLFPLPAADVNVRLHFSEAVEDSCYLYYATETGVFSQEQCIAGKMEADSRQVTFRLDKSLEKRLTGVRLDFPAGNNLIGIEKVTLSSAGIIQKQYNPSIFFQDSNLTAKNHIPDISLATAQDRAYLLTDGEDPYLILSEGIVAEVKESFSHFFLTRIGICLFIAACFFMNKKKAN